MLEIFGIVKHPTDETKKDFWTRIGRGFKNNDGSINLYFDYFPTNKEIKIQVREKGKSND